MATDVPFCSENDEGKEAELPYLTSDGQDVQSKIKRKSLLRPYSNQGEEFMRYKPPEITRIGEFEKKWLRIEYGPLSARKYVFLDFSDSSERLDEWEKAIRQTMGLKSTFRDRSKSETVRRKASTSRKKKKSFQGVEYRT